MLIMRVLNIFIGFLVVIFFSGCMASSFNEMKSDSDIVQNTYKINQNYQRLYKRGFSMFQECHEGGLITAAIIADGKLYTELKEAELTIYLMGGLGRQMHHAAEIKALDNESSLLRIYSYTNYEIIDILKREITGECLTCNCE
ncbi:hypothetical protein [Arcobacter roscoffensis]|uniref:Lipoprotein n=1 Tax=Arcobacter roscoffensis TaxID=2961520 RepID=A0ABY5E3C4_9BACT|nr:hypothetical protein [Arcobacter roscoffensis]UTJ06649.1 hypothetical protein NJU99_00740 [Arcobacter roscoffensis]